jgi:hypothetical protein
MEAMRAHFEREADLESPWSSYNPSLGRPLLNTAKFIAPKPSAAQEESSSADENVESRSGSLEPAPTLPGFER